MNKYEFTNIINNKLSLTNNDLVALQQLAGQYPWFGIAQVLLAKAMHRNNHPEYENQLKIAALTTSNRSILYNLINDLPLKTSHAEVVTTTQKDLTEYNAEKYSVVEIEKQKETEKPENDELKKPEIIKTIKEQKPVSTTQNEPIKEKPTVIPEPKKTETTLQNDVVQLVDTDGHLIQYKPQKPEETSDEEPLKLKTKNIEDEILEGFDETSLEPAKPVSLYEEIAKIEEKEEKQSISSLEQISVNAIENNNEEKNKVETDLEQKETTKIEEKIEPKTEVNASNSFIDWLNKKSVQTKQDDKKEIIENPEDKKLIQSIQIKLSQEAKNKLLSEIKDIVNNEKPLERTTEVVLKFDDNNQQKNINQNPEIKLDNETETQQPSVISEPENINKSITNKLQPEFTSEPTATNNIPTIEPPPFEFLFDPRELEDIAQPNAKEFNFIFDFEKTDDVKVNYDFEESFNKVFAKNQINIEKSIPNFNIENDESINKNIVDSKAKLYNPEETKQVKEIDSILEKFIKENPSISRPKSEFYNPVNMAKISVEEDEELVSETLAQIYVKQSLYKKAILMYEKLGLLYPNKKTYFAGLIQNLKTTHNIE
ncbi:MAG: hypothetical protein ACK4K9_08045 [Bacteroidia bacterium]